MSSAAWVNTTRSLVTEQDLERARLRARICELEETIRAAGLAIPADDAAAMAATYHAQTLAIRAVLDYFDVQDFTLDNLPTELHAAFQPLVIT